MTVGFLYLEVSLHINKRFVRTHLNTLHTQRALVIIDLDHAIIILLQRACRADIIAFPALFAPQHYDISFFFYHA